MTFDYSFTKSPVNIEKLETEIASSTITADLGGITTFNSDVVVSFQIALTQQEQTALATLITNHSAVDSLSYVKNNIFIPAREFGQRTIDEFAAGNILLGITQAGKTNFVRKACRDVTECLLTGSLYDAIAECRAVPVENKDAVFLSDTRLLALVNHIEEYLGIPLSTEL